MIAIRPSLTLLALASAALLAGCGRDVALKPRPGQPTVPIAEGATKPQTAAQLILPTSQSRPTRVIDLISKSDERKTDYFDQPPGPDNGR